VTGPSRGRHIVLVGLVSTGKSTIGELLAARLGRRRRDSDDDIEAAHGRTGGEIAASDGIEALHRIEQAHLLDALDEEEPAVIGAAASVADSEACLCALEGAFVVWLQLDVEEIAARYASGSHRRSLGDDPLATLRDQLERRGPSLARVADLEVPQAKHRPDSAAEAIIEAARVAGAIGTA
jgi:shikimate kinase